MLSWRDLREMSDMKIRLLAALAGGMLVSGTAHAMDCYKDGKCACCEKMDKKDGENKDRPKQGLSSRYAQSLDCFLGVQ